MATFWLDILAATDGTGTYASPWNGTVSKTTGWTSGDELRIKSTSVATMTTSTITADFDFEAITYRLTNVSDTTGLVLGSIIMDDVTKVCGIVNAVTVDTISFYTQVGAPMMEYSSTGRTYRVIDRTYQITPSVNIYVGCYEAGIDNISISDGWYSETQRVTDRSYITLFSFNTDTSGMVYMNAGGDRACTGHTFDLMNSIFCPGGAATAAYIKLWTRNFTNTTFSAWSLTGGNSSSEFEHGSYATRLITSDIYFKYFANYYGHAHSGYGYMDGGTFIIDNLRTVSNVFHSLYLRDTTVITFRNILTTVNTWTNNTPFGGDYKLVLDGVLRSNNAIKWDSPLPGTTSSSAPCTELTSNFSMYSNGIVLEPSFSHIFRTTTTLYPDSYDLTNIESNLINNSSTTLGTTIEARLYDSGNIGPGEDRAMLTRPHDYIIRYDSTSNNLFSYQSIAAKYIYEDISGINTYESIQALLRTTSTYAQNITKDLAIYKTSSPAYKFNLGILDTTYLDNIFSKNIHIPVEGDTSTQFTVSGWIKCDVGVVKSINIQVMYDSELINTPINIINSEADWVQFNIPFTPSSIQIAEVRVQSVYAAVGNFWLSDIEVV